MDATATSNSKRTGFTASQDILLQGYLGTNTLPFVRFARRQYVNATMYRGSSQRSEFRKPVLVPALAVEIDLENQVVGDVFEMLTRDISENSIGFTLAFLQCFERIAVRLEVEGRELIFSGNLIWAQEMGPFYGCAVKFDQQLECFPLELSSRPEISHRTR